MPFGLALIAGFILESGPLFLASTKLYRPVGVGSVRWRGNFSL